MTGARAVGLGDRLFRRAIFEIFPHPARLRRMAWPLGVYQNSGLRTLVHKSGLMKLFPERLQAMERLLPPISFGALRRTMPAYVAAEGPSRRRVGLLLGCVQRVFFGDVSAATARVLAAEGCDVFVPQDQGCCGALAEHAGEEEDAIRSARRLIDAFEKIDIDTIVINAAGCGSAMKRYGHLLRKDPEYAEREPRAPRGRIDTRVAYHDACHLQHAQGVRVQPRTLLQGIPGVDVRDVPESEICCGSAGSNPGRLLQIATGFDKAGRHVPVMHLIELLDRSIANR